MGNYGEFVTSPAAGQESPHNRQFVFRWHRGDLKPAALEAHPYMESYGKLANRQTADNKLRHNCTAKVFRPFSGQVWAIRRWRRGAPKPTTIRAQRHKLACARPGHRAAMRHRWRRDQRRYYRHRRAELWRVRVTPFPGPGGTWWSIPWEFVYCESGGDYTPVGAYPSGGAYGLIPPTWLGYGGGKFASIASEATPREQDLIAHKVWLDNGEAAWRPFEGGCS